MSSHPTVSAGCRTLPRVAMRPFSPIHCKIWVGVMTLQQKIGLWPILLQLIFRCGRGVWLHGWFCVWVASGAWSMARRNLLFLWIGASVWFARKVPPAEGLPLRGQSVGVHQGGMDDGHPRWHCVHPIFQFCWKPIPEWHRCLQTCARCLLSASWPCACACQSSC